jgi:serine/threonine protein kinase
MLDGRYLLRQRLGSGAMGQVYLATDSKLETKRVAVKILKQEIMDSEHLQENEAILRFEREAKAAALLNHPHIVAVSDYGKAKERENVFYIVMEYVDGETLHKLLRREGTLTIKRAVNLLRQIVAGVGAAHAVGILHRDLKPGNIFLLQNAHGFEDGFIKVGDFGLAKLLNVSEGRDSASGPNSRGIIGTPEFMAPEQIDGRETIDVRADIYAVGTIAYLMLGGRCPFIGETIQILAQKVNPYHQVPPLSSLRSDIPKKIEEVIMWAIEREVERRPKSLQEWIRALEQASEGVDEKRTQKTKLVILAPQGAEVYVNDERKGTVGNSEKLIISDIPVGNHVLRISKKGSRDDERVIEVRGDIDEQVIQAQLKDESQRSSGRQSVIPGVVACTKCGARFAEGVKFCGRCGNSSFEIVNLSANKVFCKRCSFVNPANANFCGSCGFPIEKTLVSPDLQQQVTQGQKVCSRCGKVYPVTVRFCGKCGISI